jgi:regulator of replication initiation timing
MSDEQFTREPPKNRVREVLIFFVVAVAAFGAGMLLESQLAAQTAASVKLAHEQELRQELKQAAEKAEKAEQDKQMLTGTLAKEREEHAKDIQSKDRHLAAFSSHATGVRHTLEADLSAARSSGEVCTARIAGISEALGGVFDSVGEVTGIAQDLGRENQQLKEDNKSLSEKLAGWQKWNTERTQRVTVVGQKSE